MRQRSQGHPQAGNVKLELKISISAPCVGIEMNLAKCHTHERVPELNTLKVCMLLYIPLVDCLLSHIWRSIHSDRYFIDVLI